MSPPKVTLHIDGMTCNNCALGIQNYLEKKGLEQVNVSFPNQEASFVLDNKEDINEIKRGINKLGFQANSEQDIEEQKGEKKKFRLQLIHYLITSVLFTIPLLLPMFVNIPQLNDPLTQLLICIPVMLIGWWYFGRSAWASLKTGVPNMDVLIFIGTTAAFAYSVTGFALNLGPNYLFFETAASIISLVLLGNYIEHRSINQTTSAIRELTELNPKKAKLVTMINGRQNLTDLSHRDMKVGQEFLVVEGDVIPADGSIVWGKGLVDESLMTGESEAVPKKVGNSLITGTIVKNGSLKFVAKKVGSQTALAQIIELVKEAQNNKPKIQKLADSISAIFVPLVLCISLLCFILSYFSFNIPFQKALLNSIAILVVACPCAMGLATPTAIMVGVGRAAKNGILFKGASSMEVLKKVKNIVFDKTGTLTTGEFDVSESSTDIDRDEFRSIIMSLEQYSSHPLARSLMQKLKKIPNVKPFHFEEVREVKGLGIIGKDGQGNTYTAGSYKLVSEITPDDTHNIYLLKNGKLIGWIDMDDELRKNTKKSLDEIKGMNIKTYLLSGDKAEKIIPIAKELNFKEYYSNKLPVEKQEIINNIKSKGTTAMVGDGINDAPSLATADVGISLSNASDIAIQSSDIVLLNGDLSQLPLAIRLSSATVKTIRQNLFWAFFYNILMIPIAAFGFLTPMIAAFAMAFSDLIVIGNSIRLKYRKV